MTTLYSVARGTRYISYDETSDRPWGFVQVSVLFSCRHSRVVTLVSSVFHKTGLRCTIVRSVWPLLSVVGGFFPTPRTSPLYIDPPPPQTPIHLCQDGVRLPDEETMLLLRVILKIGCEPGSLGTVVTNASPMDPLFWLFHPIFEKGMHILWMSPKYRDTYDFDWVAGTCYGSAYNDLLPISGACNCPR